MRAQVTTKKRGSYRPLGKKDKSIHTTSIADCLPVAGASPERRGSRTAIGTAGCSDTDLVFLFGSTDRVLS